MVALWPGRVALSNGLSKSDTPMKTIPTQRRIAVMRLEPEGVCAIRVSHRAERKRGQGHISPRYLLRCGYCDGAVQVYYDKEALEINGVHGSIENWREILLPLLGMQRRGNPFIADSVRRRVMKSSSDTR